MPQGPQLDSSDLSGYLLSICWLNYQTIALKVSQSSTMVDYPCGNLGVARLSTESLGDNVHSTCNYECN